MITVYILVISLYNYSVSVYINKCNQTNRCYLSEKGKQKRSHKILAMACDP